MSLLALDNAEALTLNPEGSDLETKTPSSGYPVKEFDWLMGQDVTYETLRRQLMSTVYSPSKPALPVKYREMVAAAVLAFRGSPTVELHLRRALRAGATMQEVVEAMETAAVPGGFTLLHYALGYLIQIAAELEAGTAP